MTCQSPALAVMLENGNTCSWALALESAVVQLQKQTAEGKVTMAACITCQYAPEKTAFGNIGLIAYALLLYNVSQPGRLGQDHVCTCCK